MSRDKPNGRRAFLLEFSKEVNERDFATQRALDHGQYLSDDKLIALKAKIKAPNPATTLQLLHMNSSAGGAPLQDQSSNSSAEDIFPATTSAYQKEQISEMVQSLSEKFKLYKQQNCQVGIGGPRSSKHFRQYGM